MRIDESCDLVERRRSPINDHSICYRVEKDRCHGREWQAATSHFIASLERITICCLPISKGFSSTMTFLRTLFLSFIFTVLTVSFAIAQPIAPLKREARSFDRSGLAYPDQAGRVKQSNSLAGTSGWVEYDFNITRTGWYELKGIGNASEIEFIVDPKLLERGTGGAQIYGGTGQQGTDDKVSNVWLDEGAHTLRIQRFFWTGFPQLQGFALYPSSSMLDKSMRVALAPGAPIYRKNACPPLEVYTGNRLMGTTLHVMLRGGKDPSRRSQTYPIAASKELKRQEVPMPCNEEGAFTISFGEGSNEADWHELRPFNYEVIDTGTAATSSGELKLSLAQEIDCAKKNPDYSGGGDTRVQERPSGSYRESGEAGFTQWQRVPDAARKLLPDPSWFAYTLGSVKAQQPYVVDVEYPDDDFRTFVIALRESAPLGYPLSGGVDTGGEFSLSGQMQTHRLLYWPRSDTPRIAFQNVHGGRRAACSKIKVFRIEGPLPAFPIPSSGRQFVNWYEEGMSFLSNYGARDEWTAAGLLEASERWARAVQYVGGTMLAPTVSIYSFALYPSRFNQAFSKPDFDQLRRLTLFAEKYGLGIAPELHPRADEIDWQFSGVPDPKPNLLVSKDGRTAYYEGDGKTRRYPPFFNPLHPVNQAWYIGMIGELADRYKDSKAFRGVSLRLMEWANPSLNNFNSLDWGYDDFTVGLFAKETGARVPGPLPSHEGHITPAIAKARYDWIMANAREQWIDWRAKKIGELYTKIRDRVRTARPDLKLYSTIFPRGRGSSAEAWREAGIDPNILGKIDGVVLVNATVNYGRREADLASTQSLRDLILNPAYLNVFRTPGRQGAFLTSAAYIESNENVLQPHVLGFTGNVKWTWTSAAVQPAGRHSLERYALAMAEADANMLGDGGNGYSLGQPVLQEFLREYHRLPVDAFMPRPDARDPVAVWTLSKKDEYWFYAVNRERFPVTVAIQLDGATEVSRASQNKALTLQDGALRIELQPYELQVFKSNPRTAMKTVTVTPPAAEVAKLKAQVDWLSNAEKGNLLNLLSLNAGQRQLLASAAQEARTAFSEGRVWRARTLMEQYPLQDIYGKMRGAPPGLREPAGK